MILPAIYQILQWLIHESSVGFTTTIGCVQKLELNYQMQTAIYKHLKSVARDSKNSWHRYCLKMDSWIAQFNINNRANDKMKTKLVLTALVVVGFSLVAQAGGAVDCPNPNGQIVTNTIPDGGTTAMLLGGALMGLGLLKKKFLA